MFFKKIRNKILDYFIEKIEKRKLELYLESEKERNKIDDDFKKILDDNFQHLYKKIMIQIFKDGKK